MAAYTGTLRKRVLERDSECCVRCPRAKPATDVHHRRPRGMGGSVRAHTNCPCNLISLCRDCHIWVELHRESALADGFLVRQHDDGCDVEVPIRGRRTLLACS